MRGLAVMAERIQQGLDCAFTIDGPRGPRYVAKIGPVLLARTTGSPIMVFHVGVDRGNAAVIGVVLGMLSVWMSALTLATIVCSSVWAALCTPPGIGRPLFQLYWITSW